jgi:hypothetical protein
MKEVWKDVVGYEGLYRVSVLGRIKSVDHMIGHWRGGLRTWPGRILKPFPHKRGSLFIDLCKKGAVNRFFVHHLVLLAFVGPRPSGMECCHGDGNNGNNKLSNLRWDTHASNEADKLKHGTDNRAENLRGVNPWTGEGCRRKLHKRFLRREVS